MNRLKVIRWEKRIKQYQLAAMVRTSATTISLIERQRINPANELKERIAKALKVPVEKIFPEKSRR